MTVFAGPPGRPVVRPRLVGHATADAPITLEAYKRRRAAEDGVDVLETPLGPLVVVATFLETGDRSP